MMTALLYPFSAMQLSCLMPFQRNFYSDYVMLQTFFVAMVSWQIKQKHCTIFIKISALKIHFTFLSFHRLVFVQIKKKLLERKEKKEYSKWVKVKLVGWMWPGGQGLLTPAINYISVVGAFLFKTCCRSLSELDKAEVGKNFLLLLSKWDSFQEIFTLLYFFNEKSIVA